MTVNAIENRMVVSLFFEISNDPDRPAGGEVVQTHLASGAHGRRIPRPSALFAAAKPPGMSLAEVKDTMENGILLWINQKNL